MGDPSGPLTASDGYRARYNLATGYATLSYFKDAPPLPRAHTPEEALAQADTHCRSLLRDIVNVLGPEVLGSPEKRGLHSNDVTHNLLERLTIPTVALLAGVFAMGRRDHYRPAPLWLHQEALRSDMYIGTLECLLDEEAKATDTEFVNWVSGARSRLPPASAYSLARYWVVKRRDDEALRDLAIAISDPRLSQWALQDPALDRLRVEKQDAFDRLYERAGRRNDGSTPGEMTRAPDGTAQRRTASRDVRRIEPPKIPGPLTRDDDDDIERLNRVWPDAAVTVAVRRLVTPDRSTACRLDVWGSVRADGHLTLEVVLHSPRPLPQLAVVLVRKGDHPLVRPLDRPIPTQTEFRVARHTEPYVSASEPIETDWDADAQIESANVTADMNN